MEHILLIVTISPKPRIKLISWPASRIMIGDENFEKTGPGDSNGFYDFLRQWDGRVVGVRFMPFLAHAYLCDSRRVGPGLRISGEYPVASVELFWTDDCRYVDAISGDQFFDYNYILKSSSNEYAVTFGFSHLEESEIEDLLSGLPKSSA